MKHEAASAWCGKIIVLQRGKQWFQPTTLFAKLWYCFPDGDLVDAGYFWTSMNDKTDGY
jgi:hypothetical protein